MADTPEKDDAAPAKKKGKMGLLIGVAGMALCAGGGFYATYSGLILAPKTVEATDHGAAIEGDGESHASADSDAGGNHVEAGEAGLTATALHGEPVVAGSADVAFIPISPLVVSLAGAGDVKHLRFTSQLEVPSKYSSEVVHLMPRVVDVMNGYLRAVDPVDLESPGALVTLRSQMLRRVELVVGPGRVSDVLIMEFVLS